ncbi:hypothetical protein [Kitasatospora cineracea]|uniref:Uncharacterized protein n=1 Tax=Kitasatospora cineracea TaxID=88074 RepID=A0A3N4R154_9ACTN|nr:hypothetical protein [Kitasatospora cineracea]RPE27273.1 hypothetical protein EDD38_7418 [Kitasatospora cineracea]
MPLRSDMLPSGPGDLWKAIKALREDLRELRAARRLEAAAIGAGGLSIVNGGALTMKTTAGVPMLFVGPVQYTFLDGSTQQGVIGRRADGSAFLTMYAQPGISGSNYQGWALYDRAGNAIVSEDAVSGTGLGLPYLPNCWAPARYTDWPASSSGTFEDIHRLTIYKQQPYASVSIGHTSDVSGTTGELQVTVNGTPVTPVTPVSFSQAAVTVGPFALPGRIRQQVEIRVQARRTAGTGNVRCQILASTGLPS